MSKGEEGNKAVLLNLLPVGVEVNKFGITFSNELNGQTQLLTQVQINLKNILFFNEYFLFILFQLPVFSSLQLLIFTFKIAFDEN